MANDSRIPAHTEIPTADHDIGTALGSAQRAAGEKFEAVRDRADELIEDAGEHGRHLMNQARDASEDAFSNARDAVELGARRARRWARRNPAQLWLAIGVVGVAALWLASRPSQPDRNFDPTRYRYNPPRRPIRKPAPGDRAASMRPSDSPL